MISPSTFPSSLRDRLSQMEVEVMLTDSKFATGFAVGGATILLCQRVIRRPTKRFPTGGWITPNVYEKKEWLKGVVTSVGDADNFRFYHTPGIGWRWPFKFRRVPIASKDLKDQTIHMRIAGIDAPEGAHFGRPAQPYSAESLEWLKNRIFGKTLFCQVFRSDQYSRVVANVVLPRRGLPWSVRFGSSLALEMLKAGWATTYEQAGAEYGEWGKDKFLKVESEAKVARRGMWKSGTEGESPAEYKRKYAQGEMGGNGKRP